MSKQTSYDKVGLLGVDVDTLGPNEAVAALIDASAPKQPAIYVCKPYVEFLDRASNDDSLKDLINGAEYVLADGIALIWAAHYLYAGPRTAIRFFISLACIVAAPSKLAWPIPGRAGGVNFTLPLLEAAAAAGRKVAIITKPTSAEAEAVIRVLTQRIPGLNIVLALPGYDPAAQPGKVSATWTDTTTLKISNANPDIVLIGMGFPLQEHLASHLASQLDHGVMIGEGGTFDYAGFGGTKPKAPRLMQRLGLEWLWRLGLEPSRFKRQLAIPRFIYKVWRSR